jgi:N6-adenosine-specific RNA methylase IME4
VTNNPKFQDYVKNTLFPHWGVAYLTTWYWLKVTTQFEMISPLTSPHKKPYESIIIGYISPTKNSNNNSNLNECNNNIDSRNNVCDISLGQKTIVSVPGIHSNKPNLLEFFQSFLPEKQSECLELFARNLFPGFTSWGNEVLKFHESEYFVMK